MVDKTRIPLIGQLQIVQPDGTIQSNFQGWLNRAFDKIQTQVADLSAIVASVQAAQAAADAAQATANSKAKVTPATSAPSSPNTGDVWIDTSASPLVLKTWNGSAWQQSARNTTSTSQVTDDAGLGQTASWPSVTGTGKPADNATVGSDWNANLANIPTPIGDGRVGNTIGSNNRLINGSNVFPAFTTGVRSTNTVVLSASDDGTSTSISIAAHTRTIPGSGSATTISYNSGTISGLSYGTDYFVYCDDANQSGGSVTYVATTNQDDLTVASRVLVGDITTPTSGGTSTTGGGTGYSGGTGGTQKYIP